jgi:plastocyanin
MSAGRRKWLTALRACCLPSLLPLVSLAIVFPLPVSSAQELAVTGRLELARPGSSATQHSANGVVWLVPLDRSSETSSPQIRQLLVQRNKSFSPHLVVVPVGGAIAFPNRDPFFHNVFSLFDGKRFDLGLYEAGSSRTVIFDREGISYIFCNIHPEMSAVVVALKTPYFGVSDARGLVSILNVPPGRYELHVWHERAVPESLDSQVRVLVVSDAQHSFGTLHLAEQQTAAPPHKNKYGQDYEKPSPSDPVYPQP